MFKAADRPLYDTAPLQVLHQVFIGGRRSCLGRVAGR